MLSNEFISELLQEICNPEIPEQLNLIHSLIDDDKIEESKLKLKELSSTIGENHSEITRLRTLIDYFHSM